MPEDRNRASNISTYDASSGTSLESSSLQYLSASGRTPDIGNATPQLLTTLRSMKESGPYTANDIQWAFNKMKEHKSKTTSTAPGSDSGASEGQSCLD
ncbi:hypothetical protein I204_07389 [Kwoniella mangroviensis CBS 8886]|uniref:hypothetical protein n=1 Tax=Kwoniella mangroviensis CBS 8507 TaxID=1296122 RepID=UPI00080D815A|nr:uncharacterized protein I203_04823 [Kwoniella mangroviensis CBS 8507]OCF65805.1 hypothetical protein I203_04823 [Kwoniella mangroviensis CBS 8507]OCF72124.1 hypothetical protein I204_07389 [Kwoniella mangroviensis CBS 8886]